MASGTVKFFNADKGYGFISASRVTTSSSTTRTSAVRATSRSTKGSASSSTSLPARRVTRRRTSAWSERSPERIVRAAGTSLRSRAAAHPCRRLFASDNRRVSRVHSRPRGHMLTHSRPDPATSAPPARADLGRSADHLRPAPARSATPMATTLAPPAIPTRACPTPSPAAAACSSAARSPAFLVIGPADRPRPRDPAPLGPRRAPARHRARGRPSTW